MDNSTPVTKNIPPKARYNTGHLKEIVRLTECWEQGKWTPGTRHRAALISLALFSFIVFCVYVTLSLNHVIPSNPLILLWALVVMFACFHIWNCVLKDNRDWQALLDNELERYIPADPEAFRALQVATLAEGELRVTQVRDWLRKEIPAMALLPLPPRKFQFTESLNETKDGESHV